MSMQITGAPGCWGIEDPSNPHNPPWQRVLQEAGMAGYKAIELGPYGYLPLDDMDTVAEELNKNGIGIVAGTIFDDLVSEENHPTIMKKGKDLCEVLTKLPKMPALEGQVLPPPYLVVIDWGDENRDLASGKSDKAKRLDETSFQRMIAHIKELCDLCKTYGVRPVIHPHAGGYIEFADEIEAVSQALSHDDIGFCLDTGHLYYSGMDPVQWLEKYKDYLDYVHFKDVNKEVYTKVLADGLKFFDGCAVGSMCPLGTGDLDYPAIYKKLVEIGYHGYITIEQERDPRDNSGTLKDVKASIDYLKSLGF